MPDNNTHVTDYSNEFTKHIENSLLDIWGRLGDYREYLVLVGGLAPRYITAPEGTRDYSISSHCGTMDIDFGISIAITDVQKYKEISEILLEAGFEHAKNDKGKDKLHSFIKGKDKDAVIIDFLTTKYDGPDNSLMHPVSTDLSAIQADGLGLALKKTMKCNVTGFNIHGDCIEEEINVCRPVAYIVLKAFALDKRKKDKDAYDLIFVLENYKDGVKSVVEEIDEDDYKAESFQQAMSLLEKHFRSPAYDGPGAYRRFLNGENTLQARAYAIVKQFITDAKKRFITLVF